MKERTARFISSMFGAAFVIFMMMIGYAFLLAIGLGAVAGIASASQLGIITVAAAQDATRFVMFMMPFFAIYLAVLAYSASSEVYRDVRSLCYRRISRKDERRRAIDPDMARSKRYYRK